MQKYDVAISTAGGGSLDTILCDTVDTAKSCIEYLKANSVGRGNFLGHEKTGHLQGQLERQFHAPENAPRLVDLIQLPEDREMFRTAFYQYFRYVCAIVNDTGHSDRLTRNSLTAMFYNYLFIISSKGIR